MASKSSFYHILPPSFVDCKVEIEPVVAIVIWNIFFVPVEGTDVIYRISSISFSMEKANQRW